MYLLITLVIIMGTAKCHKTMSDSELIKLPNHPIPNFMHQEEEQQQLETLSYLSVFYKVFMEPRKCLVSKTSGKMWFDTAYTTHIITERNRKI